MYYKYLINFFILLISSVSFGANLVNVESSVDREKMDVVLYFDASTTKLEPKIDYINRTVELYLKGASQKVKGKFIKAKDDKVNNLYVFRDKKGDLRFRVNYKNINANDLNGAVNVSTHENQIHLQIDHSVLSAINKPLPEKEEAKVTKNEIEKPLKVTFTEKEPLSTKVEKPIATSGDVIKEKTNDKINRKKESEIPVFKNEKVITKADSSGRVNLTIILTLGILFTVGLLFFGNKWMRKKNTGGANKEIKLKTQFHLGPKKSLAIVQVMGESILIGITDQNINHIKTLSLIDDEIPEEVPDSFATSLSEKTIDESVDSEDEFYNVSIKGIKDKINQRLKSVKEV